MHRTRDYGDDDLVNTASAARLLGVSPNTMRKYADDGLLPVRRTPGGQRRFRVRDLWKLMPERRGSRDARDNQPADDVDAEADLVGAQAGAA